MSSPPKRSQNPTNPLYPEVILSNPESTTPFSATPTSSSSSSSSLYPPVDMKEVAENLIQESDNLYSQPSEEALVKVPGAIVHLIQTEKSIELACGELAIVGLKQGDNVIAVLARVGDEIQWPLAKDEPAVKLDDTHYFFTLRVPGNGAVEDDRGEGGDFEMLNYGLTFAAKGQDGLLKELDRVLEMYSCFSVQEVKEMENWEMVARELSPDDLRSKEKKELVEENSAAYWTALAPNVEEYSGRVARLIAAGSGQLIKGILWCGDVTVDRLKWADEFFRRRLGPASKSEISAGSMERIKRVKKLTKMSEEVATGILSGVVKVSGFITGSIVNSRAGKKFFSLLPGEIVLASLDGFNKVCDAVEVAGKNVMSTTSVVTTGLVSQRYGEQAAHATNEGLDAAGHAIGTAWAVFKIRKAINPKSVLKPTTLVKAAAEANSADVKAEGKKNGS
ncbi:protein EARLY-RESPONSIVE TO DEHYDRATION 7, chloroplastic-like [Syzygium oleosum]|uniref:protein EARLY-RESPONSIVE TO DEHYDRATION 7, chloroplastic-like n=1 Tax=Syzygium oleosum TaxID=219896 RepID=UPI0024BAA740|nr:protein EARLY-RESPONSIVE TO DEHYDRATION 7, chloroplastic-like [Syzygium oleosum]